MELLQLKYFLDSSNNENFSKTAEKYMVEPSCVSISVKRLETELGCSLFDRNANRIKLNQNGRIFQKAVETALSVLDNAVKDIAVSKTEISGNIHMLIRSERRIIINSIHAFKKNNPGAIFHISHDFSAKNISEYDIIIDELSSRYFGLSYFPIITENIKIAASAKNPLCGKKLKLSDLKYCSFITMSKGSSLNRITFEVCKSAGFNPDIIMESDDPHYIRKCIELDLGIAFVPEISWLGEMGENTRYLDVSDLEKIRITCVYHDSSKLLSPVVQSFLKHIENEYS